MHFTLHLTRRPCFMRTKRLLLSAFVIAALASVADAGFAQTAPSEPEAVPSASPPQPSPEAPPSAAETAPAQPATPAQHPQAPTASASVSGQTGVASAEAKAARLNAAAPAPVGGVTAAPDSDDAAHFRVALIGDDFLANPGLSGKQVYKEALFNAIKLNGMNPEIADFSAAGRNSQDAVQTLKDVLAAKPDMAVVHLGYQDLLQKRPTRDIYADLQYILHNLEKNNILTVFYEGEVPPNLYEVFNFNIDLSDRYKANYQGIYRKLARMYRCIYQTPITEEIGEQSYYLMPDKVLPNQWGVRKAAGEAAVSVAKLFHYRNDQVMLHNLSYNAPKKVVVTGERLTSEFEQYADISFPHLLEIYFQQERMKPNVTVLAMSQPDMDSDKIFKELRQVAGYRPAVVALQIGINDISYASPDYIAANLVSYVKSLQQAGIRSALLGVRKVAGLEKLNPERTGKFLNMYAYLGKTLGVPAVPDLLKNIEGYQEGQSNAILSRDAMMEVVRTAGPYIERALIESEIDDRNKARTEPLK